MTESSGHVLDYSSPQTGRANARRVGTFVASIAVVAAVLIVWRSAALAQSLIEWGSCGTGRQEVGQQLLFGMPFTCAVPGVCWWYARSLSFGVLLCRLSFSVSVVGWLASVIFVL